MRRVIRPAAALVAALAIAAGASGCGGSAPSGSAAPSKTPSTSAAPTPPHFDHIVVAVIENHGFDQVLGSGQAPFLDGLAASGVTLTSSYAVAHPSQPNYLALFSGSTQGLTDDSCPHEFSGPNLAGELRAARRTFVGYSESLPSAGYTGCTAGGYARKHNPWVDFPALPADVNQPVTAFPSDFTKLPTVSFVVPNQDNDMHDGTVATSDRWLSDHLGAYVQWARTHNSLLILTADEDDYHGDNRIPTVLAGAHLKGGTSSEHVDHYGVLRTILDCYGLPPLGEAASATPLLTVWAS